MCRFVIANSEDKDPANAAGNTPLDLAVKNGRLLVGRFLIWQIRIRVRQRKREVDEEVRHLRPTPINIDKLLKTILIEKHICPGPTTANLAFRWPLTYATPSVFHADRLDMR